jgi:hypothetical protein
MGGGVPADPAFLSNDVPYKTIAAMIEWALVY